MEPSRTWSPLGEEMQEPERAKSSSRLVNIRALLVLAVATMVPVVTLSWSQQVVRRAIAQQQIGGVGPDSGTPQAHSVSLIQFDRHSLVVAGRAGYPKRREVPAVLLRSQPPASATAHRKGANVRHAVGTPYMPISACGGSRLVSPYRNELFARDRQIGMSSRQRP